MCPYFFKDKLTLFATMADFKNSTNNGFIVTGSLGNQLITLRLNGNIWKLKFGRDGELMPTDSQCPKGHEDISEIREISVIISTVLKDYSYLIYS